MSVADWEIAYVSASKTADESGAILWEPYIQLSSDETDTSSAGPCAVYQGLGLASVPYQKDENGYAECLRAEMGGRIVCIGGRDTRTASVVGDMKPGDTTLHSTGPQQAAQCFLKEEKRQAGLRTKDSRGKDMLAMLDGVNDKMQFSGMGAMLEYSRENGWVIAEPGGAFLQIHNGQINHGGVVNLSMAPKGLVVVAPVPGTPPVNGVPAPGVYA